MSNNIDMYDNKAVQSLNAKLEDFYKRWDSMSEPDKKELFAGVKKMVEELDEAVKVISESEPTPELLKAKKELSDKLTELARIMNDMQLAIGHRLVKNSMAQYEYIKKLAEEGNEEAIKAWEKLKPDYIAMLQSGQQSN